MLDTPAIPEKLSVSMGEVGILSISLNDVARRNALSKTMISQLKSAIDAAGQDPAVKVIILEGKGPAFCAGHDLKELTKARKQPDRGRAVFTEILTQCAAMMQGILTCDKPILAMVSGIATAAGCQLVASCDLAFADENAKFATPGVHIGLFCSTPMVALSRNVTNKNAMEMLLVGDPVSADHAKEIGLINGVFPAENLQEETLKVARKIAAKSSHTLAIGKRAFYQQKQMTVEKAYTYCTEVMIENMLTHDAEEGIGAFIDKRTPNWQNR